MNLSKRLSLLATICLSCVGCDQSTKTLAKQYLPQNGMDSYLFDTVRIGYAENTGSFLGLGADLPDSARFWLLTVLTGIVLIGLFIYLLRKPLTNLWEFSGWSFFFAGGVSNVFDRAYNDGVVIDFLNVGLGSFRTGIFNIADVALMIGLGLILYSEYAGSSSEKMPTNN